MNRNPLRSWVLSILCLAAAAVPTAAQDTRLLVVVGLGGDPGYREVFHGWATDLISASKERFGLPESHIRYLGERPGEFPGLMNGRSTVEIIDVTLGEMAREAGPGDQILVVLIGHGTGQGEEARFNLPGPDLDPQKLDMMLSGFSTQTVAVVNTSPSSGPFLPVLSGTNRIILTATRSAQERNETQFGGFFVEAVREEGSDLDKDGRVSLSEAFQYAIQETDRYYASLNLLATEHAQLDDNGDGEGSTELGEGVADGLLAAGFWLGASVRSVDREALTDSIVDPELRRLYEEREDLERRVRELRALRGQMEESRYEEELERLFVELALKAREIREKGGGGG